MSRTTKNSNNEVKALRITSGTAKNKRLKVPNFENFRAVQEIAKLAIFSILAEKVIDARCLDLFAGSGNLGLEALSRGASWCDFIDEHYDSIAAIRANIEFCGFNDKAADFRQEAVKFVGNTNNKYDIVFLDPFYEDISHVFLMENLEQVLNDEGIIVFLHGANLDMEKTLKKTALKEIDVRKFGASIVSFINK